MSTEKTMILEMLKEGKITTEEAEKLLNECEIEEKASDLTKPVKSDNKKFLHIRVLDNNKATVNVNIPLALAEVGLKMVPQDKLNIQGFTIKPEEILSMIQQGTEGELVNIDVNENDKAIKIKIYID